MFNYCQYDPETQTICLDPLFVLLPIDAKKDRQAIYLNYSSIANVRIKTILEYGIPVKVSEIHFHDGQQLDIYPSSRAESLLDETALYLRLLKNNLFDLSETL